MKGVPSCDKLWGSAWSFWSIDARMWVIIYTIIKHQFKRNAGNQIIQVPAGKETKRDFLSKVDRKGNRTKWISIGDYVEMCCFGLVTSAIHMIRTHLERWTIEGESPVGVVWRVVISSRVPGVGIPSERRESETSNSKYSTRPIANKYHEGMLKRTRDRELKDPET